MTRWLAALSLAVAAHAAPVETVMRVDRPGGPLGHVLKAVVSDDRAANLAAYADPGLPLAPGLLDAIAKFVLR